MRIRKFQPHTRRKLSTTSDESVEQYYSHLQITNFSFSSQKNKRRLKLKHFTKIHWGLNYAARLTVEQWRKEGKERLSRVDEQSHLAVYAESFRT
jgi:hypothetical protein